MKGNIRRSLAHDIGTDLCELWMAFDPCIEFTHRIAECLPCWLGILVPASNVSTGTWQMWPVVKQVYTKLVHMVLWSCRSRGETFRAGTGNRCTTCCRQ